MPSELSLLHLVIRASDVMQTRKWRKLLWGHMTFIGEIRNVCRILLVAGKHE
jgi:hypothetical protein